MNIFWFQIIIDNAVAKKEGYAVKLQEIGEFVGEPFEISSLRREDFTSNKGMGIALLNLHGIVTQSSLHLSQYICLKCSLHGILTQKYK